VRGDCDHRFSIAVPNEMATEEPMQGTAFSRGLMRRLDQHGAALGRAFLRDFSRPFFFAGIVLAGHEAEVTRDVSSVRKAFRVPHRGQKSCRDDFPHTRHALKEVEDFCVRL